MEDQLQNPGGDTPLRVWLLTQLVMLLPLVNIIMLFVWAFTNNTSYPSRSNWAKSSLILMAVFFLVYSIFIAIFGFNHLHEQIMPSEPIYYD
ncbi:MAG: hypothetical protein MI784_03665 [Cytophagales bacterium]|nr:hypothetical protein [Cytophagales bacterium]